MYFALDTEGKAIREIIKTKAADLLLSIILSPQSNGLPMCLKMLQFKSEEIKAKCNSVLDSLLYIKLSRVIEPSTVSFTLPW